MSFKLINLPIEPIEDRYSNEWSKWFYQAFKRRQIDTKTIRPKFKSSPLDPGKFLNPYDTFSFKQQQLNFALSYIQRNPKNRFVVFLHDCWYPGMEAFAYLRDLEGIPIKIVGFWHAGSYLSNDMLGIKGMHSWARGSEQTWFNLCDAVCVGSNYHRDRILASLGQKDTDADKVHVTYYPIEVPDIASPRREDIVVWPHRIAEDKHPEWFDLLINRLSPEYPHVQWIRTKEVCKTKEEYHELLAKAKVAVSTATMETFGIAMVEAAWLGCYPVVPNALSYKETMEPPYRYNTFDTMVRTVQWALNRAPDEPYYYPYSYRSKFSSMEVTNNICFIIRGVWE